MKEPIDPDLDELLLGLGSPVVDSIPLQGSGYPGYRPSAWHVRLADGRSVKARLFGNRQRAAAVQYVLERARHPAFPKPMARRNRALLTEWVPGRSCAKRALSPSESQEIGSALGFLHSLRVPEDCPYARRLDVTGWQEQLSRNLDRLVIDGVLAEGHRRAATAFAAVTAPPSCTTTFVHRDFCQENFVERDGGGLACVDSETLGIDTREFDLGRVWYRWPMGAEQQLAFLRGYEDHSSAEEFRDHDKFWLLIAVADASVYRLTRSRDAARAPLAILSQLLDRGTA